MSSKLVTTSKMQAMTILLVKLSSLGDVIHNFPVVSDIKRHQPDAVIDWVTEAPYVPLVQTHPSVNRVFGVHLRQLKKNWLSPPAWSQLRADKAALKQHPHDHIIDTQGLLKSVMVAKWAKDAVGSVLNGMNRESAREPLASRFYDVTFDVSKALHAVARNRLLAAKALGYSLPTNCDYGLDASTFAPPDLAAFPLKSKHGYVVLLHATSRADKQWQISSWIALGKALNAMGFAVILPSGNANEFATSQAIAAALDDAAAFTMLPLVKTASLLAHAAAVVGVDTGLAHLAVALRRPTVGIYVTTDPARTGLYDDHTSPFSTTRNLGGGTVASPGNTSVGAVLEALSDLGVPV
jgi:heptosyltransferase I